MTVGSNSPRGVLKAALYSSPSLIQILLYPQRISNLVKYLAPQSWSMNSGIRGNGVVFLIVTSLRALSSCTGRSFPSLLSTQKKGLAMGDLEGLIYPFCRCSVIYSLNALNSLGVSL